MAAEAVRYNGEVDNRLSGQSVYRTEYDIVWIPKYRRRVLNPGVKGYLEKLFPKFLKRMPGCEIGEYIIQVDHIHMVMVIPPRCAVSEVIGQMKQWTASRLMEKLEWLQKVYWGEAVLWSPGYFVSTVGI